MEGDTVGISLTQKLCNFNPLPPHGGRQLHYLSPRVRISFQSTPSAWRETTPRTYFRKRPLHFNPLPPHGGRHTHLPLSPMRMMYFNPLPPHGGRLIFSIVAFVVFIFQSTPSAWRETRLYISTSLYKPLFQSTPSAWRETIRNLDADCGRKNFNPLPPHGGRP